MMNNVVLMFSPTDEKTPYEQGEKRTVIRFSRSYGYQSKQIIRLQYKFGQCEIFWKEEMHFV